MSARIGPNIVTDGLVLYLDAGNEKSFCGEPTTNLCGLPAIGAYNNPGFPVSTTLTGEYYKGSPIYKISFTPTTATHITNLGSTQGFGSLHASGTIYYQNTDYMASIYFKSDWPLLNNVNQGFNNTYSNIPGWGSSSTTATRYTEGEWTRLYTKFYKSGYLTKNSYVSYSHILNTSQTETIIVNCPITTATDLAYLYAIYNNTPSIVSNGGLTALSILNHGLESTGWTKLSGSNLKLKAELPFDYYIQLSVPSTEGIDKTVQLRNIYSGYYTAVSDAKYWKVTFDISTMQTGNTINTYWACPMIEQKTINKPSFYTSGTRGTSVATGGGWKDSTNNTNDGTLSSTAMTFDIDNMGSLLFDGTDNHIILPNDVGYTSAVSVFSWVKCEGTPKGGYHIIIGGPQLEISIPGSSGKLRIGVTTSTNRYVSEHGSGLTDGNWHYIGFTFNGTIKIGYIDGINVGSQTDISGSLLYNFSNRMVGRFGSDTTYAMNGRIASISIFNRALFRTEVLQNYNALKSRYI